MELKEYWIIARKWWWLLVLCTLLGGSAAYLVSRQMTPTYEASTLLMVGSSLDVVNPTTGEIQTSEKLAQTYAQLVKTRPILDATIAALNLPGSPEVTVSLVTNTQLMRITVADSIPQRAAAAANELANQLIQQSPSGTQREEQAYREFVTTQLSELEQEIASITDAISSTQELGDANEVARLQSELTLRRDNYSSLLTYIKGSSTNQIRVIEDARVPTIPSGPKVLQNTLLAAVVGLMLAAGGAFLIEYLDDSIKGQLDLEQSLGLPTLGTIAEIDLEDETETPELVSITHPESTYCEAYRIMYTNLRYSLSSDRGKRVFLVTSVAPGEGKTTTACNLAVVMARSGSKTILIDGDLRRPSLYKVFECMNTVGLSSLLVGEATIQDALQATDVEGLTLLASGPHSPNAAELLNSPRMIQLLEELSAQADAIVIDSPPLLAVADASILASLVTGTVLVTHIGRTRLSALAQAAEVVNKAGGNLLGVVLNRLSISRSGYYSSYYNYYNYNYHYYHYSHYTDDTGMGGGRAGHERMPGPWWQRLMRPQTGLSRPAQRHETSSGDDQ